MTEEHLAAVLGAAEAKKDGAGWQKTGEGRLISLHVAVNGAGLSVGKIEAVRVDKGLLKARTVKGEVYVIALADVFAGAVEAPASEGRQAGFR